MIVHLVDGTYELFRHFYGLRRFTKGKDRPYGAVVGVLQTVLQMLENGDTYLGVATDHVIESFRNRLWADYKTGARTAAHVLHRYGQLENFPSNLLGEQRDLALLFKNLATLRTDAPLFKKVETLRWRGATPAFAAWAGRMEAPRLLERCDRVKLRHAASKAASAV